tara:strand:+ start:1882 stop:2307 length:426 start_codon:yes stop_codon:yes gene_type:complete
VKKNELKTILKPLIKECIKEVIFEDGTLSGIITEVAKGLQGTPQRSMVQESAPSKQTIQPSQPSQAVIEARKSLEETKRQLQESTGLKGIFENTTPLQGGGSPSPSAGSKAGALRDVDPNDPGVDINGLMNLVGGGWRQIK